MQKFLDSTPIGAMTIGDLKELLRETFSSYGDENSKNNTARPSGRLVYGLHGIETLFGVSHKTAQMYKDTFLAPAVRQNGRKIVVDADLAMELFNERRTK